MEDICRKRVSHLLCEKDHGVHFLSYQLQGKGEGRYLTKGGFTSAVSEILLCCKEWKMSQCKRMESPL